MTDHAAGLRVQRLRPAYEQVADQLRQLILAGDLKPGDQLPTETKLCEIFGVSRSTVREAVRLLTAQDLVKTTRGVTGGSFVSAVDTSAIERYLEMRLSLMSHTEALTVDNLLEARELLEVPAARLAALRSTPEQVAELRQAAATSRSVRFRDPFPERREFHQVLVGLAQNPMISMMSMPTFQVLQSFRRADMKAAYWDDVDHDHDAIVDVIEAHDEDAAAALMRDHLERLRTLYFDPEA